jgi:hypothetical protein
MSTPANPTPTPTDKYRLATSDDIPRAVERLLQWAIRLACYGVAVVFAGIAIVGVVWHWPWPVSAVLAAVAVAAICAGRRFGGPCPLVFEPCPLVMTNPASEPGEARKPEAESKTKTE